MAPAAAAAPHQAAALPDMVAMAMGAGEVATTQPGTAGVGAPTTVRATHAVEAQTTGWAMLAAVVLMMVSAMRAAVAKKPGT